MEYHSFPQTHWSLVRRAGAPNEAARREALVILVARYAPALRSYLRGVRRMNGADADDLLQGFIADQMLERRLAARADASRGRFRTLLLTCLNHYAIDRARAANRRAAGTLEDENVGDAGAPSPEARVEAAWARSLIREVLHAMRAECVQSNRGDVWKVFEARVLAEIFGTGVAMSYEQLAGELELETPTQAANLLVTAKRMYARLLREAVNEYEMDEEGVDAEIAELRRILSTPGIAGDSEDGLHLNVE